jgi:hypothetical protein
MIPNAIKINLAMSDPIIILGGPFIESMVDIQFRFNGTEVVQAMNIKYINVSAVSFTIPPSTAKEYEIYISNNSTFTKITNYFFTVYGKIQMWF